MFQSPVDRTFLQQLPRQWSHGRNNLDALWVHTYPDSEAKAEPKLDPAGYAARHLGVWHSHVPHKHWNEHACAPSSTGFPKPWYHLTQPGLDCKHFVCGRREQDLPCHHEHGNQISHDHAQVGRWYHAVPQACEWPIRTHSYAVLESIFINYTLVTTVAKNKANFTPWQIQKADEAQRLCRPSKANFEDYMKNNRVHNCLVNVDNAKQAMAFMALELQTSKGRCAREPNINWNTQLYQSHTNPRTPPIGHPLRWFLFVQGLVFLHTISCNASLEFTWPIPLVWTMFTATPARLPKTWLVWLFLDNNTLSYDQLIVECDITSCYGLHQLMQCVNWTLWHFVKLVIFQSTSCFKVASRRSSLLACHLFAEAAAWYSAYSNEYDRESQV